MSNGNMNDILGKVLAKLDEESVKSASYREQVVGFRSEVRERREAIEERLSRIEYKLDKLIDLLSKQA